MIFDETRRDVAAWGLRLERSGLLGHTAGNISARVGPGHVAITPSGMRYDEIAAEDVVVVTLDGHVVDGMRVPSSELPMHLALYQARPDAGAIVHMHSTYATTLAVLGLSIPAVHYSIATLGASCVPLAPYATYGTDDLAERVRAAIGHADGALLAHHGAVALGADLAGAASAAETLEFLARTYYLARLAGEPVILPDDEIARVQRRFRTYGQPASDQN